MDAGAAQSAPAEIQALLDLACGYAQLAYHAETPGSGIPLPGTNRHTVSLAFEGIDAFVFGEAFITAIPTREFVLAGKRVLDAAIVTIDRAFHLVRTVVTLQLLIQEN
jgi:hypothetical protein